MRAPVTACLFAALSAALAVGCSSPYPDLTPDAVRNVPAGTGLGTGASGFYGLQRRTLSCTGTCTATVGGVRTSFCEVGALATVTGTVTQTEGLLVFTLADLPPELRGGIDADGSYDVGGYGTRAGLDVTMRSEGLYAAARFDGTARRWTHGTVEGQSVDCLASYDENSVPP